MPHIIDFLTARANISRNRNLLERIRSQEDLIRIFNGLNQSEVEAVQYHLKRGDDTLLRQFKWYKQVSCLFDKEYREAKPWVIRQAEIYQ